MHQLAVAGLAGVATALNALYVWPQVCRAHRIGVAGVSASMVVLGLLSRVAWALLAIHIDDPFLLLGQAPPALAYGVLLALLFGRANPASRGGSRTRLTLMVLIAGAVLSASAAIDITVLAGVAVVSSAATALPQLHLLRRRAPTVGDSELPSGYTYLSQFVDHDITFDPTSMLDQANDPDALENFELIVSTSTASTAEARRPTLGCTTATTPTSL